jgi:UDP-N-acetylmuramoylalanine-D-glutamate ligase
VSRKIDCFAFLAKRVHKEDRAKSARPQNNQITGTTAIAGLLPVTRFAIGGDIVLLSPACASCDMFDNFQHRGHEFASLVRKIKSRC